MLFLTIDTSCVSFMKVSVPTYISAGNIFVDLCFTKFFKFDSNSNNNKQLS